MESCEREEGVVMAYPEEGLNPCAKCGYRHVRMTWRRRRYINDYVKYFVICDNCGAVASNWSAESKTRERAKAWWNKHNPVKDEMMMRDDDDGRLADVTKINMMIDRYGKSLIKCNVADDIFKYNIVLEHLSKLKAYLLDDKFWSD